MSSPPLGVSKQRLNYHWTEMWVGPSNLSHLNTFYQGKSQRPILLRTPIPDPPSLLNLSMITLVIRRPWLFTSHQGVVHKVFPWPKPVPCMQKDNGGGVSRCGQGSLSPL